MLNSNVSRFSRTADSSVPTGNCTAAEVVERIKDQDPKVVGQIAAIREIVDDLPGYEERFELSDDEDEIRNLAESIKDLKGKRDYTKRNLPAVTFSAKFHQRRVVDSPWDHTGLVVLDLDHLDDAAAIRDLVIVHAAASFISPSGGGVKIVVPVEPVPTSADEHQRAWAAAAYVVKEEAAAQGHTIEVDKSGKDVTRLTIESYDPDARVDSGADAVLWREIELPAHERVEAPKRVAAPRKKPLKIAGMVIGAQPDFGLDEVVAAHEEAFPDGISKRSGNDWRAAPCPVCLGGTTDRFYARLRDDKLLVGCNECGSGGEFFRRSMTALGLLGEPATPLTQGSIEWRALTSTETKMYKGLFAEGWQASPDGCVVREEGTGQMVFTTLANRPDDLEANASEFVTAALEALGVGYKYNVRLLSGEWQIPGITGWATPNEGKDTSEYARVLIHRHFRCVRARKNKDGDTEYYTVPFRIARGKYDTALTVMAHDDKYEWDPFLDYIENLKWDGQPRLHSQFDTLFGLEDTPEHRWASAYTHIQAVRRAMTPGCKADEVIVLAGKQRVGKTTWTEQILPDLDGRRVQWHTSKNLVNATTKERMERVAGRVIIEMPELSGLRIRDLDSLKAFITDGDAGGARKSYGRDAVSSLRRFVLVATTDKDSPLPDDPAGNRRFFVLVLQEELQNVTDWMDANRDQLWAEAVHLVKNGADGRLPRSLALVQVKRNEEARAGNETMNNAIRAHLDGSKEYTLEDAAKKARVMPMNDHNLDYQKWQGLRHIFAAEMKACGWVRNPKRTTRVDGKVIAAPRTWRYERSEDKGI